MVADRTPPNSVAVFAAWPTQFHPEHAFEIRVPKKIQTYVPSRCTTRVLPQIHASMKSGDRHSLSPPLNPDRSRTPTRGRFFLGWF